MGRAVGGVSWARFDWGHDMLCEVMQNELAKLTVPDMAKSWHGYCTHFWRYLIVHGLDVALHNIFLSKRAPLALDLSLTITWTTRNWQFTQICSVASFVSWICNKGESLLHSLFVDCSNLRVFKDSWTRQPRVQQTDWMNMTQLKNYCWFCNINEPINQKLVFPMREDSVLDASALRIEVSRRIILPIFWRKSIRCDRTWACH